jgi:hypothetical protein
VHLEQPVPARIGSLERHERARVHNYSHGFSGGLS